MAPIDIRVALLPLAPLLLTGATSAQFNEKWSSFQLAPGAISSAVPVSSDDVETDLDWGDIDLDGDTDLVVARKEPFTTAGMRPNLLLLNEAGVLTDRTTEHASSADVAGDEGFLTPTNDRDVVLADVDGDGFPEVITACEQTVGMPKHISHPRVYRNLGSSGGAWQGLHYEEARIPQLHHHVSGVMLEPRFMAVDAGDLDMNGSLDLYFGDHDTGLLLFMPLQVWAKDTDDCILRNDGAGFFTDDSFAMMDWSMLSSKFCNSVVIDDFNGDGAPDVLKQVTYEVSAPQSIRVAYNDPSSPGTFPFQDSITMASPYFVNAGDLNNDGRLDIAVTQNDDDVVLFNMGTSPQGVAQWSSPVPFDFISGGEAVGVFGLTYSSNNLITDLDGDGWNEVLIADVDVEIPEYVEGLRLHLFHNRGGAVGSADITLREERAGAGDDHWVGVHGLLPEDMRWTHDVAVFDVDQDSRQDLILSRREGTQVWLQTDAPTCQSDLGFGDGGLVLEICGGDLSSGNGADLLLFGGPPSTSTLLVVGTASNPTPFPDLGITVAPFPPLQVLSFVTDAAGELAIPIAGGNGPATFVLQAVQVSTGPTLLVASNAIQAVLLP